VAGYQNVIATTLEAPLKLINPSRIIEKEFVHFIAEFNEKNERLTPYSLEQGSLSFSQYIQSLNDEAKGRSLRENWVPATTFFLVNNEGVILGATNIRHKLTEALKSIGGHIGYGIRPSVRGAGYGSAILQLALIKAKNIGLQKVLLTCNKTNISSAKIILKNKGYLDSEETIGNEIIQRYLIKL
jgi:predicted acetyltransferase